jgi:hypothetical protein
MLAEIEDLSRQLKQETNKGKTSKEEHLRALLAMLAESKRKTSTETAADLCECGYRREVIKSMKEEEPRETSPELGRRQWSDGERVGEVPISQ